MVLLVVNSFETMCSGDSAKSKSLSEHKVFGCTAVVGCILVALKPWRGCSQQLDEMLHVQEEPLQKSPRKGIL